MSIRYFYCLKLITVILLVTPPPESSFFFQDQSGEPSPTTVSSAASRSLFVNPSQDSGIFEADVDTPQSSMFHSINAPVCATKAMLDQVRFICCYHQCFFYYSATFQKRWNRDDAVRYSKKVQWQAVATVVFERRL